MRARMEVPSGRKATVSSQLSLVVAVHGALLYATIVASGQPVTASVPTRIDTIPFVVPGGPARVDRRGVAPLLPARPVVGSGGAIDPAPALPFIDTPTFDGGAVDLEHWLGIPTGTARGTVGQDTAARAARRVDTPPSVVGDIAPKYPETMARLGIEGHVVLDFVVDTTGTVRPGSTSVIQATNPTFAEAARTAVERAHFRPGRIGGRAVPTLVRQKVVFEGRR